MLSKSKLITSVKIISTKKLQFIATRGAAIGYPEKNDMSCQIAYKILCKLYIYEFTSDLRVLQ